MRPALAAIRYGLPAAFVIAGVVAFLLVGAALGTLLIGTGVLVLVANLMIRLSVSSQDDRERERRNRSRFRRTGRWTSD